MTWLLTCTLAGVIATAAAEGAQDVSWAWAFAWIGHLAVAGIGVWGLILLCIHAGCLGALVHGTERVLRVAVIAFISQLTTSGIVVVTFEPDALRRVTIVWLAFATPAIVYLIGGFLKQAHE